MALPTDVHSSAELDAAPAAVSSDSATTPCCERCRDREAGLVPVKQSRAVVVRLAVL
jgi:hypothetical protein